MKPSTTRRSMKSTVLFLAGLAVASASYGQSSLTAEVKQQYTRTFGDITKAAERMPDADYGFKPAEGNTRTFGQIIGHIADGQLLFCGAAMGEQKATDAERTKTSKADLVAALKESSDYCDRVYGSLTDATAAQMVKLFGRDQTKLGVLYANVIHNSEMYGQIVTYYRAKGLVPPSTADRPNMGKKKQ